MKIATDDQIVQLRRHAVNDVTRQIMREGVMLTHEQADDLGEEVIDWCLSSLSLGAHTDHDGVRLVPAEWTDEDSEWDGVERVTE